MADDDWKDDLHPDLATDYYGCVVGLRTQQVMLWIRDWWKAVLIITFFGAAAVAGVLVLALPHSPQW